MTSTRDRAEKRAAEQLAVLRDCSIFRHTHPFYTQYPEQNLIPGVEKRDFWSDLATGAGGELNDVSGKPAKFCAAFSSAALAVNAFGPFRHRPEQLVVNGGENFSDAQFEKPLPTGLSGTAPHLDFYAAGPGRVVCVESKFLELLWPKAAFFADSYDRAVESLADNKWSEVFLLLKNDPHHFSHLDAAQLVKHYLGICNSLDLAENQITLLYIYWEPSNADNYSEYTLHREEMSRLKAMVDGSAVKFVTRSYPELWSEWRRTAVWSGMDQHVQNLEHRYAFSI